ncbi:MAG: hypothetical protein AAGE98_16095, partial [Actinomycetota bacterium]
MEVEQLYGDEVRFVGVPSLSDAASMRDFVESTGTSTLPHIPDESGNIWDRFGVTEQRTYVFIDDDGSWRSGGYGSLQSDVEALIAS